MKSNRRRTPSLFCCGFFVLASSVNGQGLEKNGLEKKIIGDWKGDEDKTQKYWKENDLDDTQRLLERVSKTSISFLKDGELKVEIQSPNGETVELKGKYDVTKADKPRIN